MGEFLDKAGFERRELSDVVPIGLSNVAKRQWTTPSITVVKEASDSENAGGAVADGLLAESI